MQEREESNYRGPSCTCNAGRDPYCSEHGTLIKPKATIVVQQAYQSKYLKDLGITTAKELIAWWDRPGADPDHAFVFFSGSGTHGSYSTLDDISNTWGKCVETEGGHGTKLTAVIYEPRVVNTFRGEIRIEDMGDIAELRRVAQESLRYVYWSQSGNYHSDFSLHFD